MQNQLHMTILRISRLTGLLSRVMGFRKYTLCSTVRVLRWKKTFARRHS